MKIKKILLLLAPAMLLASCNPTKATTTISKIDLTNAKTLIMGKLSNSSVTSNDEEEQLISVDEEGNATKTEVEVTTGNKTTETTNITISRLVKLNKEYAVITCTYNDVTYDLIVNLKDGSCVKFPDSSLLPNCKEKLGGHKAYRKYHKKYGYLNRTIVQPNEDVNIFYYVNHYQCDAADESVYARRLVVLDLTGESPSAKAIVTPAEKHSVQSFAVDSTTGAVVYVSSDTEKIEDDKGTFVANFDKPQLHYDDSKDDVEVSVYDGYEISNYLIPGNDGYIYCYLKKDEKYYLGKITITVKEDSATAVAALADDNKTELNEPNKVLTIRNNDNSYNVISVGNQTKNIDQLLSFTRSKKDMTANLKSFSVNRPGPVPGPSHDGRKDGDKPQGGVEIKDKSGETLTLNSIEDAYSGTTYSYFFGSDVSGNKRFRKVQFDGTNYQYIETILEKYFTEEASEDVDVAEIETDEATDDVTVVVEDDDKETVIVDDGESETEVSNVSDVSDVVDVNN